MRRSLQRKTAYPWRIVNHKKHYLTEVYNNMSFEIKNGVLIKYTGNDAVVTVPDGVKK